MLFSIWGFIYLAKKHLCQQLKKTLQKKQL